MFFSRHRRKKDPQRGPPAQGYPAHPDGLEAQPTSAKSKQRKVRGRSWYRAYLPRYRRQRGQRGHPSDPGYLGYSTYAGYGEFGLDPSHAMAVLPQLERMLRLRRWARRMARTLEQPRVLFAVTGSVALLAAVLYGGLSTWPTAGAPGGQEVRLSGFRWL